MLYEIFMFIVIVNIIVACISLIGMTLVAYCKLEDYVTNKIEEYKNR